MISPTINLPSSEDLATALRAAGLSDGDIVYLSTQLYGIGLLRDVSTRGQYVEAVYSAILSVIGPRGTLVVPTFTQQVGRFGVPFILEETESLTGIFGEYIRMRSDSIRSLHPVFSVSSIGRCAGEICNDVSPVAFGVDSAFDRMVSMGAKAVCMGFDYYSGHITSLMHLVETAFAVPYYYNKLIYSPVIVRGLQVNKPYVINVKYLDADCNFDYRTYIDALEKSKAIGRQKIGRGMIYSVDCRVMFDTGVKLLKGNIYAFLSKPPEFKEGRIPMDGPPDQKNASSIKNLAGSLLL